ncbi:hypothetical protein ES332_D02G094300v1 [Gossypium tomentosum]|uniref:Uncharacterized protein n=1 Tax=Gossypium tomentosum TaxID=34277 RepID=A0A5D2LV31_GOSTO|nr:hypothetical protein ES332_D02G094300v1 [Gossypium tomentosum]
MPLTPMTTEKGRLVQSRGTECRVWCVWRRVAWLGSEAAEAWHVQTRGAAGACG